MAKPANQTNDYDPHVINALLGKIDGYDRDLLSERGSYMATCRGIRESMKAVYDEAKTAGIPTKELRTLVAIRKNERKNTELFNELEGDQQDNLARLAATEKVKDLPLWRASFDNKPAPGVDIARTASGEHPDSGKDWERGFKPLN
jgi:Uncharacterized protein conserved in bacteria (DUF2312)